MEPQQTGTTTQLSRSRQENKTTEPIAMNNKKYEERISTPHQGEQVPVWIPQGNTLS